jgi:hypothetical protein
MKMYNYLYLLSFSLSILFAVEAKASIPPRFVDADRSCPAVTVIRHETPSTTELRDRVREIFLMRNFQDDIVCFKG